MSRPSLPVRLGRDIRGAVAIEFAFLAPVLLILYFGVSEVTVAMMAQRRLSHTTSLIGDIAAQNATITQSRVTDIFSIGKTVMSPFSSTNLKMCLVSLTSDTTTAASNGTRKGTVAWTANSNASDCPKANATVTVSDGVLPKSSSVIMSTASYTYSSPTSMLVSKSFTFKRTFYLRPRKSDAVTWATS